VLQCISVCCSVSTGEIVAVDGAKHKVCGSVWQCVAAYCSVLQCVAVCCIVSTSDIVATDGAKHRVRCSVLQVLQCAAMSCRVCCSVLQCVVLCAYCHVL